MKRAMLSQPVEEPKRARTMGPEALVASMRQRSRPVGLWLQGLLDLIELVGRRENEKVKLKIQQLANDAADIHEGAEEARAVLSETEQELGKSAPEEACARLTGALYLFAGGLQVQQKAFKELAPALGVLWQFPSDHLPVGVSWRGLRLASWNLLNSGAQYMAPALNNKMGLRGSMIGALHDRRRGELTRRDHTAMNLVLDMLKSTHVVCLQGCSHLVKEELRHTAFCCSERFRVISLPEKAQNSECIVYDSAALDLRRVCRHKPFGSHPDRLLTEVHFKLDTGATLKVFNVHLPGEPYGSARKELAAFLRPMVGGDGAAVVMGDFNFTEEVLSPLLPGATFVSGKYPTTVTPSSWVAKRSDHAIWLSKGAEEATSLRDLVGKELCQILAASWLGR